MKILVGFTQPDPNSWAYRPFSDGYRPGAFQVEVELTLPSSLVAHELASVNGDTAEQVAYVAEAVFEATNDPSFIARTTLAGFIQGHFATLAGYTRSLSVGDTVAIVTGSEDAQVHYEAAQCEARGWSQAQLERNPITWNAYLELEAQLAH